MPVRLLAAGAAKGIVSTLFPDPAVVDARYASALATRDAFVAGQGCDVVILPDTLAAPLLAGGRLFAGSERAVGAVRTALAVPQGASPPRPDTGEALRAVLLAASAFFVPDVVRSTAGMHVAAVLRALGIDGAMAGRLHDYPTGEGAMAALAASGQAGALGCTQATEIIATPGVVLAGALPAPHGLQTTYVAAVSAAAADRDAAGRFVQVLTAPGTAGQRSAAGWSEAG